MPAAESPQPLFKILDVSYSAALEAYALNQAANGRDIVRVLQRIMRYWMSLAVKDIPKPEREKLQAYLIQTTRHTASRQPSHVSRLKESAGPRVRAKAERNDALRNSVASRIVAAFNYYGARFLRKDSDANRFYQLIQQFIKRRTGSSGLLKSGFLPGFRELRAGADASAAGVAAPPMRAAPGAIRQDFMDDAASIVVDNWAAQREDGHRQVAGVAGLAPRAFEDAVPDLEVLYTSLLLKNLQEQGAAAGFTVS